MVELQSGYEKLKLAGIELYAISYDEPDALADFAKAHAIQFPLLSDPDSRVIESFGILNTLIPPDDHPWYGIPFPGTYLIARDGAITHKFFENSLAIRIGAEHIATALAGDGVTFAASESSVLDEVTVEVTIDDAPLAPGQMRDLVARFQVPAGQHLYDEPVAAGMLAASIDLDETSGVMAGDIVKPPTQPLVLSGTGETLNVYAGSVTLRRAVSHNGSAGEKVDGQRLITLSGEVRWQSCDDTQCGLPQRQRFELRVPAGRITLPDLGRPGTVEPMNGAEHLNRMIARRSDRL